MRRFVLDSTMTIVTTTNLADVLQTVGVVLVVQHWRSGTKVR